MEPLDLQLGSRDGVLRGEEGGGCAWGISEAPLTASQPLGWWVGRIGRGGCFDAPGRRSGRRGEAYFSEGERKTGLPFETDLDLIPYPLLKPPRGVKEFKVEGGEKAVYGEEALTGSFRRETCLSLSRGRKQQPGEALKMQTSPVSESKRQNRKAAELRN